MMPQQNYRLPESNSDHPQISSFVEHKQIRILMVSFMAGDTMWQIEQMIAEQLRLLAKELVAIKAFQSFSSALHQLNPDLLLVVGNEEPLSSNDLDAIRAASVKKRSGYPMARPPAILPQSSLCCLIMYLHRTAFIFPFISIPAADRCFIYLLPLTGATSIPGLRMKRTGQTFYCLAMSAHPVKIMLRQSSIYSP